GSHDYTIGAHRCAQTYRVGVDLHAVVRDEAVANIQIVRGCVSIADRSHPAVAGLAETSVQLHDFEVVACTQVPGLDRYVAEDGAHRFSSFQLVVSKGSSQGAIAIAKTSGPGAGVRLASTNVKL